MMERQRRMTARAGVAVVALVSAGLIAGCASQPTPRAMVAPSAKSQSKEYFSEKDYGVKASPRVTNKRSRLPRGGGRDQVGKPYQVRGKWYYPKEQPGYTASGKASWYGDAFHGRLTANGEIYDMTHLSAAHPTMPLPSYARVTNLKNGSSIIVRVNDRGPYAQGRVIDLSKRAAEMLDYTHSGIADVKVDYVGRAPLEGADDEYLLASYKPGNGAPDPSDGMPTGVMIAMAGPTPTSTISSSAAPVAAAVAFPGALTNTGRLPPPSAPVAEPVLATNVAPIVDMAGAPTTGGVVELPETGPVIKRRPTDLGVTKVALAPLSYADARVARASGVLSQFADGELAKAPFETADHSYVAVGTFADRAEAQRLSAALAGFGKVNIETTSDGKTDWHSVTLRPNGHLPEDAMLKQAWAAGAPDAFIVRD